MTAPDGADAPAASRRRRWPRLLVAAIPLAALALFVVKSDRERIEAALSSVTALQAVVLLALLAAVSVVNAARFQAVVAAGGGRAAYRPCLAALVESYGFVALPAGEVVGGAVRWQRMRGFGLSGTTAVAVLVVERLLDVAAWTTLVLVLAVSADSGSSAAPGLVATVLVFAACTLVAAAAMWLVGTWLAKRVVAPAETDAPPTTVRARIGAALVGITAMGSNLRALARAAGATILLVALTIATQKYMLVDMLGFTAIPMGHVLFATSLAGLSGLFPLSPAGIGVKESVLVLILAKDGFDSRVALAYTALLAACLVVSTATGLIVHFARARVHASEG